MTEDNVLQLLVDYTTWKYEDEILRSCDECPYDLELSDEEFVYKQLLTWFMLERTVPATGKTVLEEFVEQFVSHNTVLAKKVLGMKELIANTFVVRGREDNIIVLEGESSSQRFNVWVIPEHSEMYAIGRRVKGRIYKWGDVYRFAGITKIAKSDGEIARETGITTPEFLAKWYERSFVKEAESLVVSTGSSLSSMLNKLPSQWINGICASLLVSKKGKKREKVRRIIGMLDSEHLEDIVHALPWDACEALTFVMKKGGMVRYKELVKKFDDDTGMWWEETPSSSAVGTLRRHALLVVGKMPKNGRFYKVTIIPREVMRRLSSLEITSR